MYAENMSLLPFANCFPLSLVEQYAYTSGQCHVFLEALQRLVEGQPRLLVATDPRHLAKHGWPTDHRLDLHVFLELPNGEVLDAEGRRSRKDLLKAFGVKTGWTFAIESLDDRAPFGKPKPELVDALEVRLKDLGWTAEQQPACEGRLSNKEAFALAEDHGHLWWRQWQRKFKLPQEAYQIQQARWEGFSLANQKLELGENPFHVHAHLPDMIKVHVAKHSQQLRECAELLAQPRHRDGKTPIHLMSEVLTSPDIHADQRWPLLVGAAQLIQHLLDHGGSDVFRHRVNGQLLGDVIFTAMASNITTLRLLNLDLKGLQSIVAEEHLERTLESGPSPRPKVRL